MSSRHHNVRVALTYDDVLLVPKRSCVKSRKQVSTATRISRNVRLNVPIVSSNMDTVTEAAMAVSMAREGGIGILHRFCRLEEQVEMVRVVKRAQSFVVADPRTIGPDATCADALVGLQWGGRKGGVGSLMVVNDTSELIGVITRTDLAFAPPNACVSSVMTPRAKLVIAPSTDMSISAARELLHRHRLRNLPIVDSMNRLHGLITASDIRKMSTNDNVSVDKRGQLLVGAAIGVKHADLSRAEALVEAGVDVIVIDIAHGHSDLCIDMVRRLKSNKNTKSVDVVAGNIATAEGARDLIAAGADGLKVGVGPGSICITRVVAGAGMPQLTAILDVASVARPAGVPIIADGGVRSSGDVSKAIAAGADTVMLGNYIAGTDESPGQVLVKDGKKVKIIRGMAGFGANISKAERENQTDADVFLGLVPEGVEGNVPYKGPVGAIISQLVGGLRSGISYCGACDISAMQANCEFTRMSPAGLKESGFHDISKL